MPITTSGTTSVSSTTTSIGVRTRARAREMASAAAVPSTVETIAVEMPIRNERPIDAVIESSSSAAENHFVEKPSQTAT